VQKATDLSEKGKNVFNRSRDYVDEVKSTWEKMKKLSIAARKFALQDCKQELLTDEQEMQLIETLARKNQMTGVTSSSSPSGGKAFVYNITKHWAPGTKLGIYFMDGAGELQEKVKRIAKTWETYANIEFNFNQTLGLGAEIRITFTGSGCSSKLGRDCLLDTFAGQSTMTLAGVAADFNDRSTDHSAEIQRHVLHEFGHVLGLCHEHSSPNSNLASLIDLNKMANYTGWSTAKVIHNLQKLSVTDVNATSFDDKSIMLYAFPKELFIDESTAPTMVTNTELSEVDKREIGKLYPRGGSSDARFDQRSDPMLANIIQSVQTQIVSPLARSDGSAVPAMNKSQSVFWKQLVL